MNPMTTSVPGRPPIQFNYYDEQFAQYYPDCELVSKGWWVENVQPDWVIFDCGANVGYNTILMSQLAPKGQIHAFEPTGMLGMLMANLSDNEVGNAVVHNIALTGPANAPANRGDSPAETMTVDEFVARHPVARLDAIKIDLSTFGLEQILQGAEATLRRFAPYIIIDSSHAASKRHLKTSPVFQWLSDHGYNQGIELEAENYVLATPVRSIRPVSRPPAPPASGPGAGNASAGWSDPFNKLRQKWSEVPAGNDQRRRTTDLLTVSDDELRQIWLRANEHDVAGTGFGIRGWYHRAYGDLLAGKKVLDVGSGIGISTLEFAMRGAQVTFCDIARENLAVLQRLCGIFGVDAEFHYIEDARSFAALPSDFDVVTALGSLINAPSSIVRTEVQAILPHLKVGGRWLHFAYPKRRWEREGSPHFSRWGEMTDGPGTPWMEYHERDTMDYLFAPVKLRLLFECSWHNDDFNWFDYELVSR